jgi:hypothetical protein
MRAPCPVAMWMGLSVRAARAMVGMMAVSRDRSGEGKEMLMMEGVVLDVCVCQVGVSVGV